MDLILNIFINILDILVVSFIFYRILLVIRGTRTIQIVLGIMVLVAITVLSRDILHLRTLAWLISQLLPVAAVILAVVFQTEIRYALATIGSKLTFTEVKINSDFLKEIVEAAVEMSRIKMGALIVLERKFGLKSYTDTGVRLDAKITSELLLTIFNNKAPIHDGAIIVTNEKIHSAGCVLPISTEIEIKHLGTRHRAAIGISAITDALVVVVSEETGRISIAMNGKIEHFANDKLLETLSEYYTKKD